jgi:hypothetical protein
MCRTSLRAATDSLGVRRQAVLVDRRGLSVHVLDSADLFTVGREFINYGRGFLMDHAGSMADAHDGSGHVVNVSPVSSSTRVTRASGRVPC